MEFQLLCCVVLCCVAQYFLTPGPFGGRHQEAVHHDFAGSQALLSASFTGDPFSSLRNGLDIRDGSFELGRSGGYDKSVRYTRPHSVSHPIP